MKLYILFLFFALSTAYSKAQSITLRILGQSNYIEHAESNVVLISTDDSSVDKIEALKDTVLANGLNVKLSEVANFGNGKTVQYKIDEKDINVFDQILVRCSELEIKIDKVYFRMPEHILEEEDKKAISALRHANSQAKMIANHLGYSIDEILNIDDETTYANSIYDDIDLDSERGELFLELLKLLGGRNTLYETESSSPSRTGGYNLWVTYALKKK
jgi:hypothetical protein